MIFLRTFGPDESTGVSDYVSIPQPIGVQDGDLLLVGIMLPDSSIDVAAPDDGWTLVARTDKTRTGNVAVFWRFALNEPARWVFTLSSTVHPAGTYGLGGVLVYGGADGFEPVEAFATATSPSGTAQNVPAITAAEADEEMVLFLGADNPGTFTPLAGYEAAVARAPGGVGTFEAHHRQLDAAGTQSATTVALSVTAKGACIALALRPSAGTLSVDDVRERLVAAFPRGVEDVYDLTASGDYYKLFQAVAALMKVYAFDLVDLLRREIIPHLSRYKLPSWERIFGLETTRIAKQGTIPQRQAQVLGAWRAAAGQGSSIPVVQAVLGPLLGYLPTTTVEVLEADRSALTAAHSYWPAADTAIPNGATTTIAIDVSLHGGKVAKAGAQLWLVFASAGLSSYTFTLTAPDGSSKTWAGSWASVPLKLYAPELADKAIQGIWRLSITNNSGADNTLYSGSTLFVEGVAPRQDTAGAVFHWGVYADPAHVGESGVAPNYDEAFRAIKRLTFSHCRGRLLLSKEPWPGTSSGAHAAIPGRCIPT